MKYEKPAIAMSLPAISAVQGNCEKGGMQSDAFIGDETCGSGVHSVVTAYEADE
jgi:hypothetical protein